MKKNFASLFLGLATLSSVALNIKPLFAEDEFEHVEVLDHPRYSLTDRLNVDAGISFLPLDAYYKPVVLTLGADYQFYDWLAIEPISFGWSMVNYDTGLKNNFNSQVQNTVNTAAGRNFQAADDPLRDLRFTIGSMLFFNLLYSKSNWFNQSVVYHYWQLGVGVKYFDLDSESQIGIDLALRIRFFLTNHILLNITGGDTIGFKSDSATINKTRIAVPTNFTELGAGLGYAF